MPCFRQNSRIDWCIFAISGVGGGTQWSSVTTIFSGSQTFIVPISLKGSRAIASISCMYNRSTSPSTIWPGLTDSVWLARARTFSDIVWPVIGIGGCTGAARPINMAMDGPKALREGVIRGPLGTSSKQGAAFAMLCLIWGSTWLAIRIGLEGAPPFLSASLRFAVAAIVLVILAGVFRSKWPQNRTEWALVGFVGIVLFTADYGLIYWGENNGVLSGLSAILFATFPLQTALVANAFLKAERFTIQKMLGIGVGFGGVVLIFRSQLGIAGLGQVVPMLSIVLAATWPGRDSSSWESMSRRPGGRPRSPAPRWGSPAPTPIPRTHRPARREPGHFGAARPAFRASAQNSSSVTPRCRSARSRNKATKAC